MSRLFENRITPAGKAAIADLIDHVARFRDKSMTRENRRWNMSKKDLQKELGEKGNEPSTADNATRRDEDTELSVFYRCTCPECGENTLELSGFGVFFRSEFLGVTNEGEFGCGDLELDGEYHWVLECGSCGYRIFDTDVLPSDTLLDWAAAHGQAINHLEFTCPVCGSECFDNVEIHLKRSRSVRAVYEIRDNSETEPHAEVALSFERAVEGGKSVRYCCARGHELAKDDGSPVQNAKELVAWLKARRVVDKG
jgi:hypothetical protein